MAPYDLLVRNGILIDGTRAPRYAADLAVRDGRIAAIGRLDGARAERELDASGRIVAPGFIDAHTHDDRLLLSGPDMAPKASQGVTTVVAGNCGVSLAPAPNGMPRPVPPPLDLLDAEGGWFRFPSFAAYVEELRARPAATNCALLVGHTSLRAQTMDRFERPASDAEIARMRALADEALAAGAIGISTGLWYEPAAAAPTEEVIEVCRPLAARKGLYCTHMRDEADKVLDSLEETFRIGRELGVPVVISHHKVMGLPNHGRSAETLPLIEARMRGSRRSASIAIRTARPRRSSRRAASGSPRRCSSPGRSRIPSSPAWSSPRSRAGWASAWMRRSKSSFRQARSTSRWTRPTCSASSPSSAR